jgi:hypothetical protein
MHLFEKRFILIIELLLLEINEIITYLFGRDLDIMISFLLFEAAFVLIMIFFEKILENRLSIRYWCCSGK